MKFWSGKSKFNCVNWDDTPEKIEKEIQNYLTECNDIDHRDVNGWTFLMHAAYKGYSRLVAQLLKNESNPNLVDKYGKTALMWANNVDIVKMLIDYGADITARDRQGKTPLIHAVQQGLFSNTSYLLEQGADANMADNQGKSPLLYATTGFSDPEIISVLIQSGADTTIRDQDGKTPLMHAALMDDVDSVQVLLENRDNVNARDHMGKTALMFAAARGDKDIVRLLLTYGANVVAKDNARKTAQTYAIEHGYSAISSLLSEPNLAEDNHDMGRSTSLEQRIHDLDTIFNSDMMRKVFMNSEMRLEALSVIRTQLKRQEIQNVKFKNIKQSNQAANDILRKKVVHSNHNNMIYHTPFSDRERDI